MIFGLKAREIYSPIILPAFRPRAPNCSAVFLFSYSRLAPFFIRLKIVDCSTRSDMREPLADVPVNQFFAGFVLCFRFILVTCVCIIGR